MAAAVATTNGAWHARRVVGAASPGGMALPAALPTPGQVYAPRGVHLDDDRLIVADTGNHRVLIFELPMEDEPVASVVLGQPDAYTEGRSAAGMNLPTGIEVHDGALIVADAWNHRVLVWWTIPTASGAAPDLVLGQPSREDIAPNRGGNASAVSFYWPFGVRVIDGRFYVADTGNRRVLCWVDGVPRSADVPADVILGQPDANSRDENRGGDAGADSFRWPHTIAPYNGGVLVADAGNHRLLGWESHPEHDGPAQIVIGQPDMISNSEFPWVAQTARGLRFPYAADIGPDYLAVCDTANNRVVVWDGHPSGPVDASWLLGQESFGANGENRWDAIGPETMCWPYGISCHGDRLAVADSGNNRVVLWERHL